ncbi:Nucleolar Complex 2 protein [Chytridiales sp. JEL 0842]|nr:Nucleolar Complex 2 protein [Chytridiales sp. JEL 0842]
MKASKAKASTLRPLDFTFILKTPNPYLGTRVFQTSVAQEAIEILYDHYDTYATSISFPELSFHAVLQLKKYMKHNGKSVGVNKQIQSLVESLEMNAKFVEAKRNLVDFSPKDEDKVASFLSDVPASKIPLHAHTAARKKMRESKMAAVQAEAAQVAKTQGSSGAQLKKKRALERSSGGKKGGDGSDDEDEVGEFELSSEEEDEEEDEEEMEFESEDEEEMEEEED